MSTRMFHVIVAVAAIAAAATVMISGKDGWGWLVFIAFLALVN